MGSVRGNDLAQSLGHRQKQFWQAVMVDHLVCHIEQSLVTAKIRFSLEMTVPTQFARAPTPLEQTGKV
jgi:hypothetical protein